MRKILINNFGGADVLSLQTVPTPSVIEQGDVLIKVDYAGINPIDYKIRNGTSFAAKALTDKLPCGLGFEVAGVVVEVADTAQVTLLNKYVCGFVGFPDNPCGYGEYVVAKIADIAIIPNQVSHNLASILPLAGLTALQALLLLGELKQKRILIHAGAGGVGHIAIQLAKLQGAYVFATASKENHDLLYQLGADQCIDYHCENELNTCRDLDGVIDLVGKQTGLNSINFLNKTGLLVTVPTITRDDIISAANKQGVNATGLLMKPNMAQLMYLLGLVAEQKLKPHISHTYPLSAAKFAHQQLETGHVVGKLCLAVAD